MTPIRAGAIALTLIIAVPIILGYGLASEETTKDVDVTENTGSLSDVILNSTSPYYVAYNGANNNGPLLRMVQSQGELDSSLINPGYTQTSQTTYTSTPIYSTGTATVDVPASSITYPASSSTTYGVGSSGVSYDVELPSFAIAGLTVQGSGSNFYNVYTDDDAVAIHYNTEFYAMASGSGYLLSGTDAGGNTFAIQGNGFHFNVSTQVTMYYNGFYTIPDSFPDVWSTNLGGQLVLNLTIGSDTTAVAYTNATSLVVSYSNVTVLHGTETDVYTNVTGIGYAQTLSSRNFVYSYQNSTPDYYADASYGWTIPTSSYVYYDYWLNGFANNYVRMMIGISAGENFTLTANHTDGTPALRLSSSDSGQVTANIYGTAYDLGTYTNIMIEVNAGTGYITVTGIASWPSIGVMPEDTYNSVTGYSGVITDDFTALYISDSSSHSVDIRVDSAEIVAGYFPSTENYVLNLTALYPESTRQSIVVDSIGVYGDYLDIGAERFTVSDNTITLGDDAIPIKGMEVSFEYDGNTNIVYVNGEELDTTSGNATVGFGGEWSLTLHRNVTTTESIVQTSWVPGEFVLDENGFVMAMLLVALAAFVGLGMTGGRSGTKVGILALICGGAVLTGLIII